MRIVQVAPRGEQPWSGVLTSLVGLSTALARRGLDVEVWQLHDWDPAAYADVIAALHGAAVPLIRLPLTSPWIGARAAVRRLEAERRPDVAHLHSAFNPWNTAVAAQIHAPYVLSPHSGYDAVSRRRSRGRKTVWMLAFERRMLARAALVCALTDAERASVRDVGGARDVRVLPNGVAPPAPADPTAFRATLSAAPDSRLAVFLGRLDVLQKGLDTLVRAVAETAGWHLALVGPDHYGGELQLRRLAELCGAAGRVTFAGPLLGHARDQALAAADLFVLPSRWEGLPMSLLEALARGRPALVSPAVERAVPVAAAGAGWVSDEASLATTLNRIGALPRAELEARGRAAVDLASRYDWDSTAAAYEQAYRAAALTAPRR